MTAQHLSCDPEDERIALQCIFPFTNPASVTMEEGPRALRFALFEISYTSHSLAFSNMFRSSHILKKIHPHWLGCRWAVDEGYVGGTTLSKATPLLAHSTFPVMKSLRSSSINLNRAVLCAFYTSAVLYLSLLPVSTELSLAQSL